MTNVELPDVALPRNPRIPVTVRAHTDLRRALGRWNTSVMDLETLEPSVVEAIRLRAASHHDCRT
jgi:hypothetical protein